MPVDDRIRAYYWRLRTFLAEKAAVLNPKHPDYAVVSKIEALIS